MATLRELALAAHDAAEQKAAADRAAAEAAARDTLVGKARTAMVPVLTDPTAGRVELDAGLLVVEQVTLADSTVILATPEPGAARVLFAVRDDVARVTWKDAGAWRDGPVVRNLAEVGAALSKLP